MHHDVYYASPSGARANKKVNVGSPPLVVLRVPLTIIIWDLILIERNVSDAINHKTLECGGRTHMKSLRKSLDHMVYCTTLI